MLILAPITRICWMPQVIKLLNVLQAYPAARLSNSAKRATNGLFDHSVILKKKKYLSV